MNNTGIHHISSLVGNIHQAYHFYHHILGLKLTLKTVNQEDSSMYHLFLVMMKVVLERNTPFLTCLTIPIIETEPIVWKELFFW
ncbi:VOC family protein [Streptococcus suis]|uniref:VOC family protein n=1 Tax=Streptococcus suis TaxID=1307 RepID=UPI000768C99D|nr:VOC family protein [Streptococcus suis]CYV22824.1 glyoxalase [Streptococcus suis]